MQYSWLENPDDFWNFVLPHGYKSSSLAIANNLFNDSSMAKDICLVDNLTCAIAIITNSIISNISTPNSVVLISNHTYNAVKNAIYYSCSIANKHNNVVEIVSVDIPFPLCEESTVNTTNIIINAYKSTLEQIQANGKCVVFAFLDHITSVPCMLLPIREIISVCREYGTKEILVDGAHTPGQLDLTSLDGLFTGENYADYYCSNLHKWCFAPPSVAFLWVSPNAPSRHQLHHPIPSHRYNETPISPGTYSTFSNPVNNNPLSQLRPKLDHIQHDIPLFAECAMLGTRDYASMLVVPEIFTFINNKCCGIRAVQEYNVILRDQVISLLSQAWNTEKYIQHSSLLTCSMGMIGCPSVLGSTWEDSDRIRVLLRNEFNIVIQKLYPVPGDRLYLRLSIAVYNTLEEFVLLKDAILTLVARCTV